MCFKDKLITLYQTSKMMTQRLLRVEYQQKGLTMTLALNCLHYVRFARVRQEVFSCALDIFFFEVWLPKLHHVFLKLQPAQVILLTLLGNLAVQYQNLQYQFQRNPDQSYPVQVLHTLRSEI